MINKFFWIIALYSYFLLIAIARGEPEVVHIGGIFTESENEIFTNAIEKANAKLTGDTFTLSAIVENLSPNGITNPLVAFNSACSLLQNNSKAIFGPSEPQNIQTVQSFCDEKEIPHIIASSTFAKSSFPAQLDDFDDDSIIDFFPHASVLSRAYFDLSTIWDEKTFTVFYEDNASFLRISDLIVAGKEAGYVVSVKQLDETGDGIYRDTLKEARVSGQKNYVIDCRVEILEEVLLQAQQIGLMTPHFNFFITNLDMHTINLEPFQFSEANITGIRIVNPENVLHKDFVQGTSRSILSAQEACLVDAVALFADAISEMPEMYSSDNAEVSCDGSDSLLYGTTFVNFIKRKEYSGITGINTFDNSGRRTYFELEVIELTERGLRTSGVWDPKRGLQIDYKPPVVEYKETGSLQNRTFIVITCLTDPYGMLKETAEPLFGNDRFEGFGIDLIHELSEMEGFNYTFTIRHDKKNGAKDLTTGRWSGMIGDLIEHRADLAITDLTITSEREGAVDFTSPFMNLGISILAQKPGKAPPSFFSFADPFAIDTWTMMALAYAVVSVSLFVVGRICPDEWTNPYPCIEEPDYLVNQFSLGNSAWFAIGSLMQQGSEIAPIGIATRMVASMWWFFVLIMVASYTANLAAFLTTENPITLFTDVGSLVENAEDLEIRYGAKLGGATITFFRDSENPLYKTIYEHMQNSPDDMVKDNKDGVILADNKSLRYAFFMESTSIKYETERHCNLQMYGSLLDDKGYGIAMRKNSSYRQSLSMAILKLQAAGKIDALKRKWWEEKKGGGQCSDEAEPSAATPLQLVNVAGVFYVTMVGVVCSIGTVLIEMFVNTIRISNRAKIPLKDAIVAETKAYINFNSNTKDVLLRERSKSPSSLNEEIVENGKPEPFGFRNSFLDKNSINSTM